MFIASPCLRDGPHDPRVDMRSTVGPVVWKVVNKALWVTRWNQGENLKGNHHRGDS